MAMLDYIWSNEPAATYADDQWKSLAIAGGGAALLGYAATRGSTESFRPVDLVSSAVRFGGNLSPFQLYNTFRIPNFLSPVTSLSYKRGGRGAGTLTNQGFGVSGGSYSWNAEYLKERSTYDWLKYTTGKTDAELASAGIRPSMIGDNLASGLTWEAGKSSHRGSLFSIVDGQKRLLSQDVMLFSAADEQASPVLNQRGLNRAIVGMFGAADMPNIPGFEAEKVLYDRVGGKRADFFFMPSVKGSVRGLDDLHKRTNYFRGIASFEMDRFNHLIGGLTEQFGGEGLKNFFENVLEIAPKVRGGSATAQFARFGIRAAAVGGAIIAGQESDWIRRQYGFVGHIGVSAAVSAGVAYVANKGFKSPKMGMMAGLAAFAGQVILPGFDQGIIQGISTAYVNLDMLRGMSFNPFSYWRRAVEGYLPGFSSWETGALASLGVMGAATLSLPFTKTRVNEFLLNKFGSRLGLGVSANDLRQANYTVRERFWELAGKRSGLASDNFAQRAKIFFDEWKYQGTLHKTFMHYNNLWSVAEETTEGLSRLNPLTAGLKDSLDRIATRYQGNDFVNWSKRNALGAIEQFKFSFFGATLGKEKGQASWARARGFSGPVGKLGRLGTLGVGTFLAHQFLTGGFLGSMKDTEELSRIYSGEQLVEIKKSRWWEAGGTPYEGLGTSYFRPHWYAMLMNNVSDAAVWGDDADSRSPLYKFFIKNFTYELEKETYYNRPYPISSAAFSDVPIIGPILGSTVGRLIKPPRLMHTGEWIREGAGGPEFASVNQGDREPAYSLGAINPGIPDSPFSPGQQLSFLSYQFRELEGMTGWAKNVLQTTFGKSELFLSDNPVLADAGRMTSFRTAFWEQELGGFMFMNEFLRRVLPNEPFERNIVNPIINSMPSWMPDKFRYGDPYLAVTQGQVRMPGPGYAAMHKELRGVDPENYPDIYKYAILSDVAPGSYEHRAAKDLIYRQRAAGVFNERQERFIDDVDQRTAKQLNTLNFDYVDDNALLLPGSSFTQSIYRSVGKLARQTAAPIEYLIPMGFRPMQKLFSDRDPIEQYQFERMYGTTMSFWDKIYRDWARPSMYSAMHLLGFQGKPLWREDADEVNEYFDKLEFIKYMQLANSTTGKERQELLRKASSTRHGVNPQGDPLAIYWTLPTGERKFFNAFLEAQGKEREKIKSMIPRDQVHLYEHLWQRKDMGEHLYLDQQKGFDDNFLAAQFSSAMQFVQAKGEIPREDWIGWHQDVNLDDIKVRYIDEQAKDLHDFQEWESTLRRSHRQPFLEGSTQPFHQMGLGLSSRFRAGLFDLTGSNMSIGMMPGGSSQIVYNDDRSMELMPQMRRTLNEY